MALRTQNLRSLYRPSISNLRTKPTRSGISRGFQQNAYQHSPTYNQPPTKRSFPLANTVIKYRTASTKTTTKENTTGETTLVGAPDITNYYTIFPKTIPTGPPPSSPFEISISDLRREFLQLQGQIHPDKYPGEAKPHAEALSARINEAYRTLVDPLLRAQYLLREWYGIDVTAEDAATKHALDAQTLMEVMEVQETIEEVGASPGAEEEIEKLKGENDVRLKVCVGVLAGAFDRGDIEGARKEAIRLRFWYSVGEGLREWEPGNTEIRLVHGH